MYDIITIGGATRDTAFLTDKGKVIETPENLTEQKLLGFEYGAKIKSEEVWMNFGGGACNAAASFARMGLNVAVCCRIGGDENGESILENLKARGINIDLVQKDDSKNSGFSFVVINRGGEGERVIFVHKGVSDNLEIHENEIGDTKWIYLTALGKDWGEGLEKISSAIKEKGIKLVWNPGEMQIMSGKEKLFETIKNTNILIVNKDEAIELVESDESLKLSEEELNDTSRLIEILKNWGAEMVAVTDGKNGAYLYAGNEILKAPALIGKQVDTTGAGDAFGSGLLAGFILTDDPATALKFGILNSSGTVGDYGAQNGIMTREEIENSLNAVEAERIK